MASAVLNSINASITDVERLNINPYGIAPQCQGRVTRKQRSPFLGVDKAPFAGITRNVEYLVNNQYLAHRVAGFALQVGELLVEPATGLLRRAFSQLSLENLYWYCLSLPKETVT